MKSRLIDQVATGVAWNTAEKVGSMLLQVAVSIIVARLLTPEDFGVMAILTFFTAVSLVVVDSGFSQTLLRKEQPSDDDYKTVFLFNIAAAAALYLLLVALSPFLARYYNLQVINNIAPALLLLLPLQALCIIQNTRLAREFRFGLLSRINFVASLIAGIAAIAVALCGGGVWALVAQRLATVGVRALLLWWHGDWRGEGKFSRRSMGEMAPFSLRLMSTDIVAAIYNNVAQLFIGKMHSADALGYFNQAQKIKELPVQSAVQSVQTVTYPALAKIKGDAEKFAESYRKVLLVTLFVMMPAMLGMAAMADDMFRVLLGEKWMPTVPYFKVIILCGIFYPIAMLAYNVLKVHSNGSIILRLELLKRGLATVILAVTIPHSIMAVAYGLVTISAIEAAINLGFSLRYTQLSVWHIARSLVSTALLSIVMWIGVEALEEALQMVGAAPRLVVSALAGVVIYLGGAAALRLEAFSEILSIARRMVRPSSSK